MSVVPIGRYPIGLDGVRFGELGLRGHWLIGRRWQWKDVYRISWHLCGSGSWLRRREFVYRVEFFGPQGQSMTVRVKGGRSPFHRIVEVVKTATQRNSSIRVEVFAGDVMELAEEDSVAFRSDDNLPAYGLEKRSRLHLLALECRYAYEDATELLNRFPRHECKARLLRLKAALLAGDLKRARSEIEALDNPLWDRRVVADAKADFAITLLYFGKREGARLARELVKEGNVTCIEKVGVEFSRYLSERSRFKEALSVLRSAENRSTQLHTDIFRELQSAQGEVLNMRDYRFLRYFGFLGKTRFRWAVASVFFLALIWLRSGIDHERAAELKESWSMSERLAGQGQTVNLIRDSVASESVKLGVAKVSFLFSPRGQSGQLVAGTSVMLADEARMFVEHPERAQARFLSENPEESEMIPKRWTRGMASFLVALERPGEVLFIVCGWAMLFLITLLGKMVRT